jgi:hypothetical protein
MTRQVVTVVADVEAAMREFIRDAAGDAKPPLLRKSAGRLWAAAARLFEVDPRVLARREYEAWLAAVEACAAVCGRLGEVVRAERKTRRPR